MIQHPKLAHVAQARGKLETGITLLTKFWLNSLAVVAALCERRLGTMIYLTRCVEIATTHHYRESQPR